MDLATLWQSALSELETEIGKQQFGIYFKNCRLLSLENGVAKIGFANQFMINQANSRYYSIIQQTLQKHASEDHISLLFEIHKSLTPVLSSLAPDDLGPLFPKESEVREQLDSAIKKAHLRSDFTFDEFCVSTSNQLAFAAAQSIAQSPGKNYNPFFLWGSVGIGKTHLMQAIGHEILKKNPRAKVVFAPGEQFTNEIIAAIRTKSTHEFREKYRTADAFLIDDVQFIAGREGTQEEFFHTFNEIQQRQGQIIMTSDKRPSDIKDLADRLKSRFEGGLVTDISVPDLELKTAVCMSKAKKRGIDLSTNIAELIANNVDNIRRLDGALQQVMLASENQKKPITEDLVIKVLNVSAPMSRESPANIDSRDILDTVCEYYGLPMKLIKSEKRDKPIVEPRQILMYLLNKHTTMTLVEIAAYLNRKDHTTIMHGIKKITALLDRNPKIQTDVEKLQLRLGL